jgi:hypothetical protein
MNPRHHHRASRSASEMRRVMQSPASGWPHQPTGHGDRRPSLARALALVRPAPPRPVLAVARRGGARRQAMFVEAEDKGVTPTEDEPLGRRQRARSGVQPHPLCGRRRGPRGRCGGRGASDAGMAGAVADSYGDCPETAAPRMRWARWVGRADPVRAGRRKVHAAGPPLPAAA